MKHSIRKNPGGGWIVNIRTPTGGCTIFCKVWEFSGALRAYLEVVNGSR